MSNELVIVAHEEVLKNDFTALDSIKDKHEKWNAFVKTGKELLRLEERCQMAIAELAIRVCAIEFTLGEKSHAYKGKQDRFTQQRFAKEIGMDPKKLQDYIAIKRRIWDQLNEEERQKLKIRQATHAARELNKKYKDIEWKKPDRAEVLDIYNKHMGLKEHRVMRYSSDGVYYFGKAVNLLVKQRLYMELTVEQRQKADEFITAMLEIKGEYNQIKSLGAKYKLKKRV